jgi:hypothetical protein
MYIAAVGDEIPTPPALLCIGEPAAFPPAKIVYQLHRQESSRNISREFL